MSYQVNARLQPTKCLQMWRKTIQPSKKPACVYKHIANLKHWLLLANLCKIWLYQKVSVHSEKRWPRLVPVGLTVKTCSFEAPPVVVCFFTRNCLYKLISKIHLQKACESPGHNLGISWDSNSRHIDGTGQLDRYKKWSFTLGSQAPTPMTSKGKRM